MLNKQNFHSNEKCGINFFLRSFQNENDIFCLHARSIITLNCKPKMLFYFECQWKLHRHSRINEKHSIKELYKQYSLFLKKATQNIK
jgi:hypothetical protein